jgi:heme/copper-type cytochrome/quinol oxidase subunit 3
MAPARIAKPNGWWGMAVFVGTEATLFGTIFGTYFYLRFHTAHWPPRGLPEPALTAPLILTAVLVATSLPMQLASNAARAGRAGATRALLSIALVGQAVYFGLQMHLFLDDLDKFSPSGSAYGSIYFTMLGAHDAHVAFGILMVLFLVLRLGGGLTRYRTVGVQSAAFYWHFVNVLALCVAAIQVYAAL